jgi:hypothetical protein
LLRGIQGNAADPDALARLRAIVEPNPYCRRCDRLARMAIGQMPPAWALQSAETAVFRAKVWPFALQDFSLFQCCDTGSGHRRWRFCHRTRGAIPTAATGHPGFPPDKRPVDSPKEIRHWLAVFVKQSSARQCRMGPRFHMVVRCRRAAIGGRRRTSRRRLGSTKSNARSQKADDYEPEPAPNTR